ncbi:hypothetical protein Sjap_024495 [Stephania japonica]|uniref:FAD-binding PCMH-type domain-containing protein n=1 Tax=Stephania japonica TaxID=461633 RepID=A0AAP0HJX2_9MAGN
MTLQQTTPSSSSLHLFSSTLPQKRPHHNLAFTSLIQHKPLLSSPHHHLSPIKCDFDELNIIHGQKLLSDLCTWGIGGPCAHFAQVSNHNQLISTIRFCRETSIGFVIVGKGSNCLFDDMGFDGCVILNRIDFVENTDDELLGGCYYKVGSGCPFNRFGIQSCIDGFGGLEFAAGIPGTVGGAVYMNAGADGQVSKEEVSLCVVPLALETSYWRDTWHLMNTNLKRSGNLQLSYVAVSISNNEAETTLRQPCKLKLERTNQYHGHTCR